ncbi:AraC family transcriptional regulator [Clostridium sp. SYSU_GA19001]|uniref:AraC family transcriptional regulator n=1 Tax=Clostridium caldaquaticum TaxID=2940653 RepID=UPI0020776C04|nr:AraC family transcriptional regulator [Clostridium caldaquaticum]MCM8710071.1 AraC family transcriptional regulator [Clostridium caldaquaticum]
MSEVIIKNQILEYNERRPFHIHNVFGTEPIDESSLLNHWHTELEIVYVFKGCSTHYIDGNCIKADAEKLLVINSQSIHSIIPDRSCYGRPGLIAVILLISRSYLEEIIPNFDSIRFVIPERNSREDIWELMHEISKYGNQPKQEGGVNNGEESLSDNLHIKGLILLLISYLCKYGLRQKSLIMPANCQKNVERLREILSYIQMHYSEPISQVDVARKFYFSSEYFSRFFRKNTGYTFVEYVTRYRLQRAVQDILYSDKSILTIALKNGFSDARRFINAFKKQYGFTPLQYRKEKMKQNV